MKAQAPRFSGLLLTGLTGAFLLACVGPIGCKGLFRPNVAHTYNCRDRVIKVNAANAHGVDHDTVVICGGQSITWKEQNNEDWEVDFTSSPFQQGQTKVKKGDGAQAVNSLTDDTAFEYSITVNGTKHDPQIIIMGGT